MNMNKGKQIGMIIGTATLIAGLSFFVPQIENYLSWGVGQITVGAVIGGILIVSGILTLQKTQSG